MNTPTMPDAVRALSLSPGMTTPRQVFVCKDHDDHQVSSQGWARWDSNTQAYTCGQTRGWVCETCATPASIVVEDVLNHLAIGSLAVRMRAEIARLRGLLEPSHAWFKAVCTCCQGQTITMHALLERNMVVQETMLSSWYGQVAVCKACGRVDAEFPPMTAHEIVAARLPLLDRIAAVEGALHDLQAWLAREGALYGTPAPLALDHPSQKAP